MSLFNYYAVQAILSKEFQKAGWKISRDRITGIEKLFKQFTDDKKLVITPRFNGDYLSIRYCGLEALQVTNKNTLRCTLVKNKSGKVRRQKPKNISSLSELKPVIALVREAIESKEAVVKSKYERIIPGFSMEHWLESLILADTEGGRLARLHLGVNPDLYKVVSQVPVIKQPKIGARKRRADHIDIFSINPDGKVVIVELKKDDDIEKAIKELTEYTNWFLSESDGFDPERGHPLAMQSESYIPEVSCRITREKIEAVAVLISKIKGSISLNNKVKSRIVDLPENWYDSPDGNPFHSCNS
jgi:hypothetical protein